MPLKPYFQLQISLIQRRIRDFGLHPILGLGLMALLFAGFTIWMGTKPPLALAGYALIGLFALLPLSAKPRNEFLKRNFPPKSFRLLRLLENGILMLPFLLGLFALKGWLWALIFAPLGLGMSWFVPRNSGNFALPTPFYFWPFEFPAGFRKTFWVLPIAWGLSVAATLVGNQNLAYVSFLIPALATLSFYGKPEPVTWVWMQKGSARHFLWKKAGKAVVLGAFLVLPQFILLGIYDWEMTGLMLLLWMAAQCYLLMVIFAKYAAFPGEISLAGSLLMACTIWFPPLVLFLVPWFYVKAIRELKPFFR